MKGKLLRVGVLTASVLAFGFGALPAFAKPVDNESTSNPDNDLICPPGATHHSQCHEDETGPTVMATGPITISSPTMVTLQVTCHGHATGVCRGRLTVSMGGVIDSKQWVRLTPDTPTTITLKLTKAGKAQAAAAFAGGPGETKGTCPVKFVGKQSDSNSQTTVSTAPDFVVG